MKVIVKVAGASRFFQRTHKKKQHITYDERVFQAEERLLAGEIGIDAVQIPNCRWFFDQTKSMKLPEGWRRQLVNHKLIYINDLTKQQQDTHPNIGILKVFFYQRKANDKAAATFKDKSRKLLPYIQEKLTKEMIGLSSKRKEAQKVNLKRDEHGKLVTSKTGRIAPDTSKLVASRNYLLKSIVDKVVTKQELRGYGKRARQYAAILDKNKAQRAMAGLPDEEEEIETLDFMDRIYTDTVEFYEAEYGELTDMPKNIDEKAFKMLTPEIVTMCIQLLGIGKEQVQQYWFGRVMNCLILPPLWRRRKGPLAFDEFIYQPKNLTFDLHPSFIYMVQQRNNFLKRFPHLSVKQQQHYLSFRQMQFIEFFERTFTIDIYAYLQKLQADISQNAILNKNQRINDWMIMEGMVAADICQQHYMLGEYIEDFWKNKNFQEEIWAPSVSSYGEVLWNHNVTGSCRDQCPYETELEGYMAPFAEKVGIIEEKHYKPIYQDFSNLEQFELQVLEPNLNQKMRFLSHFLQEPSKPYQIPSSYEEQCYFDRVFSSPFNFESDLNFQELPLWLQICRAKKLRAIVLQILNSPAVEMATVHFLYNYMKEYYLEATIRRDPNNLETVRSSLAETMNKQQLIKFVEYVCDIGQRENRLKGEFKKKGNGEKNKEKADDNVNGSSQSQIDLHRYSTDEDKQPFLFLENENEQSDERQENFAQDLSQSEERKNTDVNIGVINLTQPKDESQHQTPQDKTQKLITPKEHKQLFQDESALDAKIKSMKKKTMKVRKYSPNKHKKPFQLIDKVNQLSDKQQRLKCKQNLILTGLKKAQLPNKNILLSSPIKKSKVQSQPLSNSDVPTINMFYSSQSDYSNDSVVSLIKKKPKNQQHQSTVRPVTPVIPVNLSTPIRNIKTPSVYSQYQVEQSVLQLIPTAKQSLNNDPFLKHVNNLSEIGTFQKIFKSSTTETAQDSDMFKSSAFTKMKRFAEIERKQIKSQEKMIRPNNFQKRNEQPSPVKSRPSMTSTNFKRRCLSSTASHLLNSNAVTSRLTFQKIEIRKQLYVQNRGIRDFIPN